MHTEVEVAILVADALIQVDVAVLGVAVCVHQGSAEDGDVAFALNGEGDVLGRVGEVDAVPGKVACIACVSTEALLQETSRRWLPLSLPMHWLRSISESFQLPSAVWRRARRMWPSSRRMSSAE